MKNKESLKYVWTDMSSDYKISIRTNVLKAIIAEQERAVKFNFSDTLAQIAENIYNEEEENDDVKKSDFDDIMDYIFSVIKQSVMDEGNSLEIEAVLVIISKIFGFIYDKLRNKLDSFANAFEIFFKTNNMNVRTRCAEAVSEIYCVVSKKDAKKFKDYPYFILETCLKCLENPREEANVFLNTKFLAKNVSSSFF